MFALRWSPKGWGFKTSAQEGGMAKKGPPDVVQGWTLPARVLRKHKKVTFLAICAFALLLRIILSLHSYSGVSSIPEGFRV